MGDVFDSTGFLNDRLSLRPFCFASVLRRLLTVIQTYFIMPLLHFSLFDDKM